MKLIFSYLTILMLFLFSSDVFALDGNGYVLGAGDKLKITLYDQDDISGEYEIDGTGYLSLPLIGDVKASDKTLRGLEKHITKLYKDGYFVNPRINVEVTDFRPFFILGEVNDPGKYSYIDGMTVIQAVSVAGGYTYRAKKNKIKIKRLIDGEEQEIYVSEEEKVFPGDVVHVDERLF